MATFLDLVKETERESGTMATVLSTTASQSGRHLKFVTWVASAWTDLQRERDDWQWMKGLWSSPLLAGVSFYDAASLGIARWGQWTYDRPARQDVFLYLPSEGRSTEGALPFRPWEAFVATCLRGSATEESGKPALYSVAPDGKIHLWPSPDAAYVLSGEYIKAPQVLAADADIPEMPAAYHDAIKYRALLIMAVHDEAGAQIDMWMRDLDRIRQAMLRTQTPRIEFGGPLA